MHKTWPNHVQYRECCINEDRLKDGNSIIRYLLFFNLFLFLLVFLLLRGLNNSSCDTI